MIKLMNQKGFAPLVFIISIILVSGLIIGGSIYFKQIYNIAVITPSSSNHSPQESRQTQTQKESTKETINYKKVTIEELINNTDKYLDENILLIAESTKSFKKDPQCPFTVVQPPDYKPPTEINSNYVSYNSWKVFEFPNKYLGVQIKDKKNVLIEKPDYKDNPNLEIKGILRSAVNTNPCSGEKSRSMFIETTEENIKVLPKSVFFTGACITFKIEPDNSPNLDRSVNPMIGFFIETEKENIGYNSVSGSANSNILTVEEELEPGDYSLVLANPPSKEFKFAVKKDECAKLEVVIPDTDIYTKSN
jgi:hypothetical protein